MRRIQIDNLKPNMVLARSVHNGSSHILLQAGVVLNWDTIRRLSDLGIVSVYVKDEYSSNIAEPSDVIPEQLRLETIRMVKQSFEGLQEHLKLNIGLVKNLVDNILNELLNNPDILIQLTDIRIFDDYLFAHSVNVCVLSIMTGITLNFDKDRLKEMGIGALLHDIGKTKVDIVILNKPDDLTREEFDEVKRHTEYGFEILREYADVSLLSAHIAFQHHERWDGQGYPRGLSGINIHEYARIVAVADVYDALLADRPYRPSYTVNQALTILERMSGIYLDPDCVTALVTNVAIYPVGCLVEISTGYIGIVINVNKSMPTRPVIKIIIDNNGRRLGRSHEVDLSVLSTIMVIKALTNDDIERLNLTIDPRGF